jgi:hypothetical protein
MNSHALAKCAGEDSAKANDGVGLIDRAADQRRRDRDHLRDVCDSLRKWSRAELGIGVNDRSAFDFHSTAAT